MLSIAKLCLHKLNKPILREEQLLQERAAIDSFLRKWEVPLAKGVDICSLDYVTQNLGLNDVYALSVALHLFDSPHGRIKHGWFGQHNHCDEEPRVGGFCTPCPWEGGETTHLTSSWNVQEWFNHIKGGIGIMANQHSERSEHNHTSADKEIVLPADWDTDDNNHVDHQQGPLFPKRRGTGLKQSGSRIH